MITTIMSQPQDMLHDYFQLAICLLHCASRYKNDLHGSFITNHPWNTAVQLVKKTIHAMSFPAQEQQTIGSGLNNPLGLITAQHRSFLAHIAQTGFDDAKDAYHDLISRSPANHPGKDGIEYVGMTLVFEEEEKISGGAAPGAFDASR
jgi:hypothetical protein